jgi:membrane-associated phospholipid phosphatase
MLQKFAKIISTIGNPMTLGLGFALYITFTTKEATHNHPLLVSLLTIVPIAIYVYRNVKAKKFTNYDVSDQSQRKGLYRFVMFCFIGLLALAFVLNFDVKAKALIMTLVFHFGISAWINQKIKISMHTSINFLFAFVFWLINPTIALGLYAFGFVNAWSRIYLGRHKSLEVISGFALAHIVGLVYLLMLNNYVPIR